MGVRITFRLIVAIGLGLVVAEGLVRLVTATELDYVSFLRPGPYCVDESSGRLTSACPGRSLMMRVPGEERYIAIQLNQSGMRGPFVNARPNDGSARRRVLIVGGASQGFGFALPDGETYPAEAARDSCRPVEIHNFALMGMNNEVTWDLAEQTMFERVQPDQVIFAVYFREGHPDVAARVAAQTENEAGLRLLGGSEFYFPANAPAAIGQWATMVRAYDLWARAELRLDRATGWPPILTPPPAQGPERAGPESHAALIRALARRVQSRGIPMSVLLLPFNADVKDAELKALLPGLRVVDAKAALDGALLKDPYFPDGHYRAPTAELIGRLVADEICGVDIPEGARVRPR